MVFDAAQGSNIAYEAGKYEYDPTAIAAQDTIVLVDKPEPQTGTVQSANNFNVQYETVGLQLCLIGMLTWSHSFLPAHNAAN